MIELMGQGSDVTGRRWSREDLLGRKPAGHPVLVDVKVLV